MDLTIVEESGGPFVEGPPSLPLMRRIDDATLLVEVCLSNRVSAALHPQPD